MRVSGHITASITRQILTGGCRREVSEARGF